MAWKQIKLTFWSYYCTIVAFQLVSSSLGATIQDLVLLDELINKGYDRRATPTNHLNSATKVYCELYARSFGSPNPMTMDYKVDLYLRQRWRDERLKHKDLRQPLDLNDPNLVKAIWKPEVYFPNGKEADFQFVTVPNVLVRINPDGEILYMLSMAKSLEEKPFGIYNVTEVKDLLEEFKKLIEPTKKKDSPENATQILHEFAKSICVGENAMECTGGVCKCLHDGFYELEEEYKSCRIKEGGYCTISRDVASGCVRGTSCVKDKCRYNSASKFNKHHISMIIFTIFMLIFTIF